MGAEAVFRLLMDMGATKDIRLCFHEETGRLSVIKNFRYQSGIMTTDTDDAWRLGQQNYTLKQFLKTLIRFDKSAYKRMRNVEQKINAMHSGIDALGKQL